MTPTVGKSRTREARSRAFGPIAVKLALATVAVAVGAIAVLAALTLVAAQGDVSELARSRQERVATTVASAAADAYRSAGSWSSSDLRVASTLAADSGAGLRLLDETGHPVKVPEPVGVAKLGDLAGRVLSAPVVVDGERRGTAILHFSQSALTASQTRLRDALIRTVAAGAGLAALLALLVAVVLARWITRPVGALTRAVRGMEAGDREARVGPVRGSDELADLARAFDRMAATVSREDELRRAVVADVAHELRTPLAVLQAATESLVDGVTEPTATSLESLHDEVLRLTRIVEDLGTLASAEAAGLRLDVQPADLAEVVAEAVDSLRPAFDHAGVQLRTSLVEAPALVDRHRVVQVVGNLLTNAEKFTSPGGSVTVSVAPAGPWACVEVTDTGTGIPADELPHVFERFWRGREAGRVAGSGVGLAVVDALVRAQAGTVVVASDPGRGTSFRVMLPAP